MAKLLVSHEKEEEKEKEALEDVIVALSTRWNTHEPQKPTLLLVHDATSLSASMMEMERYEAKGPIFIGGYSFRGTVAIALARKWETKRGTKVEAVVLLDAFYLPNLPMEPEAEAEAETEDEEEEESQLAHRAFDELLSSNGNRPKIIQEFKHHEQLASKFVLQKAYKNQVVLIQAARDHQMFHGFSQEIVEKFSRYPTVIM